MVKYDGSHQQRDIRRGLMTKQIVKGAAGGIRGVDYQDRQAEYLERRDGAAAVNLRAGDKETALARQLMKAAVETQGQSASDKARATDKAGAGQVADAMDARQVVNVAAAKAETERVDPKVKLADERIKKKLLLQDPDAEDSDEDLDDDDVEIEEVGPFADGEVDDILASSDNAQILRLIQDPEVEMRIYGTLRLLDPADMREALGSPLRVARHLRVVAERMLAAGEFSRDEVIHYLTGSLVNLGREFGGSALRSFAHSVGISGIYPLEVIEHAGRLVPQFVPRLTLAPFLLGRKTRSVRAGKIFELRCDPSIKITDFALKGGGEPGYQFAPRKEPGLFALNILTPGYYTLLLQGLDVHGFERVQELRLKVKDPVSQEVPGEDPWAPAPSKKKKKKKRRPATPSDAARPKKHKKKSRVPTPSPGSAD